MNIDVRLISLAQSACVFERLGREWRDTVSEISELTGDSKDTDQLAECSGLIREYSDLLNEIIEKYEANEKKISMMSGDTV